MANELEIAEKILKAKLEAIMVRFEAMDKALELHSEIVDRRMEGLNALRQEYSEDRAEFVKKEIHDSRCGSIDTWQRSVENRLTVIETRSITWTLAIGIFFVIVQVTIRFIK